MARAAFSCGPHLATYAVQSTSGQLAAGVRCVEFVDRNSFAWYGEGMWSTMRKAFEPAKGPLADKDLENGEQQAQSDLFAGAIGGAKNPASHRDVEMTKVEAARLILFASYLMSLVESRQVTT